MVTLPCAITKAHGKEAILTAQKPYFAVCIYLGTRQSLNLCRVPGVKHTTKFEFLPCALPQAHAKDSIFAVCFTPGTRQRFKLCCVSRRQSTRQSWRPHQMAVEFTVG